MRVQLRAGDCFLLPRALPSCVASDLKLAPVDAPKIVPFPLNGRIWPSCRANAFRNLPDGEATKLEEAQQRAEHEE
jgi:hypothetical protein